MNNNLETLAYRFSRSLRGEPEWFDPESISSRLDLLKRKIIVARANEASDWAKRMGILPRESQRYAYVLDYQEDGGNTWYHLADAWVDERQKNWAIAEGVTDPTEMDLSYSRVMVGCAGVQAPVKVDYMIYEGKPASAVVSCGDLKIKLAESYDWLGKLIYFIESMDGIRVKYPLRVSNIHAFQNLSRDIVAGEISRVCGNMTPEQIQRYLVDYMTAFK